MHRPLRTTPEAVIARLISCHRENHMRHCQPYYRSTTGFGRISNTRWPVLLGALVWIAACGEPALDLDFGDSSTQQHANEGEKLNELIRRSQEAYFQRNPLDALWDGQPQYFMQGFGDYISDAYFAAERAATESDL